MKWWAWAIIGWWLFFMLITLASLLMPEAKAMSDKLFHDDIYCDRQSCWELDPYIMVETAFGQSVGYEMRTKLGCALAARHAAQQPGVQAGCFPDKESARKTFPALKLLGRLETSEPTSHDHD